MVATPCTKEGGEGSPGMQQAAIPDIKAWLLAQVCHGIG
jgi:hypothetical protein